MAIVVVQSNSNSGTINATSLAVTVTLSAVTSGNAVGMTLGYTGSTPTITSIVDNKLAAYTATTPSAGQNGSTALVLKGNVTGGPTSFTVTIGQAASTGFILVVGVYEISGMGNAPTMDGSVTNANTSFGSSFSVPFTTAAASEFSLASYQTGGSVPTITGSFTGDYFLQNIAGGGHAILSASGSQALAGTLSVNDVLNVQIGSWKPNSSGGTGGPHVINASTFRVKLGGQIP